MSSCDSQAQHSVAECFHVYASLSCSGVSQGEGETIAPRQSQQGSDATHNHPAALVPFLSSKVALSAQERCNYDYTGTVHCLK